MNLYAVVEGGAIELDPNGTWVPYEYLSCMQCSVCGSDLSFEVEDDGEEVSTYVEQCSSCIEEAKPKWHPVSESPDKPGTYLVAAGVEVLCRYWTGQYWSIEAEPTHWMELPSTPEDGSIT